MSYYDDQSTHQMSNKLSDTERNSLLKYIEREGGQCLAAGIVELWLSEKPSHSEWYKYSSGIMCFIKDFNRKSYFFCLYSLSPHVLWEQEMYIPFSYNKASKNFHYFQAEDCNAGINFSFENEADKFYSAFQQKYESKLNRSGNQTSFRSSRTSTTSFAPSNNRSTLASKPAILRNNSNMKPIQEDEPYNSAKFVQTPAAEFIKYGTIKKLPKKISKSQIGKPDDFRVVQHIGLKNNDFDVRLADQDENTKKMREILTQLNVKVNRKTQAFLGDFAKNYGGLDVIEEELNKKPAPRATTRFSSIKSRLVPSFSEPPPPPQPSIVDLLKTELDKRAQYLNQSSDEEDERSDSEWQ